MQTRFFAALAAALLLAGCSMGGFFSSSADDGARLLRLDGDQTFAAELEVGERIHLNMRDPEALGYEVVGCAFDPEVLRLEGFGQETEDGEVRLDYLFTALAPGRTEVQVRIRRAQDGPDQQPDVYKSVGIDVEAAEE